MQDMVEMGEGKRRTEKPGRITEGVHVPRSSHRIALLNGSSSRDKKPPLVSFIAARS